MKKVQVQTNYDARTGWILFILALLLYVNTLSHGYVLDDEALLVNNSLTESGLKGTLQILSSGYRSTLHWNDTELYRPLPKLMFALYWSISEGNPLLPHAMNILLYAVCIWLVFNIGRRTLHLTRESAFVAALIFCVHPLHTEVVANCKSLDEILCLLFALLSVKYLGSKDKPDAKSVALGTALFFLSVMSKESGLMLLAVIPAISMWLHGNTLSVSLKRIAAPALAALVFLFIRFEVTGWQLTLPDASVNYLVTMDAGSMRMLNALYILIQYLYKLILPYPLLSDASFAYLKPLQGATYLWLLILLLTAYAGFWLWRNRASMPMAWIGFGMIFLYWLPVSNLFFLIGTHYAERFMFVPSLGLAFLVADLLKGLKLSGKQNVSVSYLGLQGIPQSSFRLLLLWSTMACLLVWNRNTEWQSNQRLFDADLEHAPESARLQCYYANAHTADIYLATLKDPMRVQEEIKKGIAAYEQAIQILPEFHQAYESLADLYAKMNEVEKADTLFRKAIALKPGYAPYYNNYGNFLFVRQQALKALPYFELALKHDSGFAEAWNNKGSVLASRAKAMLRQDLPVNELNNYMLPDSAKVLFQDALVCFQKAMQLSEALPEPCLYASMVYTTLNKTADADQMRSAYEKRKQAQMKRFKRVATR